MIHTSPYACVVVAVTPILILLNSFVYLDPRVMFRLAIRYLNER